MADSTHVFGSASVESSGINPPGAPCIYVIIGAGGDVTKRLMMPAVYNLVCDGLLPEQFAIVGADMPEMDTEQFRARLSDPNEGIKKFHTRKQFDEKAWAWLHSRLYYTSVKDPVAGYKNLADLVKKLQAEYKTGDNILFYFAVPPKAFAPISANMVKAGFREAEGWRRIIVEKPFGTDLKSAEELNKSILGFWREDQIYRVDHYLGKETVQNLLAFRFSNGMYEPLWNKNYIDHIQFNVSEEVSVTEYDKWGDVIASRGGYYDSSGVLRDMMQNHMFQMLAYLTMEPPSSFEPDAIRNEKAKVLSSVRVYKPDQVPNFVVRGQYGRGTKSFPKKENPAESSVHEMPAYREEEDVNPQSNTETFVAAKFLVDNWRWEGVPIYLRSGKGLWKRGTEIVVQFKKAPFAIFKGTPVEKVGANRIIFHIQPFQGIETLFHAKVPGPMMRLQTVHMRFDYGEAFKASRYTGYEVMVYSCMNGDATLFSRTDLVETAWKIAQPLIDYWTANPAKDFPNYTRGTWGPKAAYDLIERDGRHWYEVVTTEVLEQSSLFKGGDPLFLNQVIMALRPEVANPGETIIKKGDIAHEMYLLCRGEVEVVDDNNKVLNTIRDGGFFGEIGVLLSQPRTATVRAKTLCDMFVLDKSDFSRILREQPKFAETMMAVAKERYNLTVATDQLMAKS